MTNQSKFTIRVNSALLNKFRIVAEYNGRSVNKELEVLMKRHVLTFEKNQRKTETE